MSALGWLVFAAVLLLLIAGAFAYGWWGPGL